MMEEIKKIYLKSLLDTASGSEKEKLDLFLQENPEAIDELRNYAKSLIGKIKEFDNKEILSKINHDNKPKTKILPFLVKVLVAALLLILPTIFLYRNIASAKDKMYYANSNSSYEVITLSDSTFVYLKNGSSLKVLNGFNDNERKVELNGQAFFDVKRNEKKPFTVGVKEGNIKVLGTSFDINNQENSTIVSVKTGKVSVSNKQKNIIIEKGQGANLSESSVTSFDLLNNNFESWRTGIFSFSNTELDYVIKDLNTYYENKIILENKKLSTCKVSADYSKLKIEEVLQSLQLICKCTTTKNNENFLIK